VQRRQRLHFVYNNISRSGETLHKNLCLLRSHEVGLLVDSEIVLSKLVKWGQDSTSNVLVCETQRKVCMYGCVSE
jgi:hypothetical protein